MAVNLLFEQTFATPAENLAADEALLDWGEATGYEGIALRIWESPVPFVVVGRGSRVAEEVDVAGCRTRGIPILRRVSGGATVVAGPGCLMYAVILNFRVHPELRLIDRGHAFVLNRIVAALAGDVPGIACGGTSDLTLLRHDDGRPDRLKCSGNSLRVKRSHLLYHGTLLYAFDLPLIAALLRHPPREPDYRGRRGHVQFVANLPLGRERLRDRLVAAFDSAKSSVPWPEPDRIAHLVAQRYARDRWTFDRP